MTIQRFAPVLSTAANVFTRDNRAAAVQAALLNQAAQTAEYSNILGIWPQIRSYENDPTEIAIPFVWGPTNFNSGLRLGFAAIVNAGASLPAGNYAYSLGTIADNAHRAFLELYTVSDTTITLVQTIFSNFIAGSLDPNIPQSPPFNWQFLRSSSGTFTTTTAGILVLSYEVQNYNTTPGLPDTDNPAMLSFGFPV
jgi:hypothetical protein